MQKFTITVADVNIRVTTEEKPEMVDAIVDILNDRIHDILTKSPGCSRNEAAILCALDYCARNLKDENRMREQENAEEELRNEIAYLRRENDTLSVELARLRADTAVLSPVQPEEDATEADSATGGHSTLKRRPPAPGTEMLQPNWSNNNDSCPAPDSPSEPASPIPAQDVMFNSENAPDAPLRTRRPPRSNTSSSKKRVGDMFDMLTFKDI